MPAASAQGVQASACAKCILVGEHFVLGGAPAIAVPIPCLRLSVELVGDARAPSTDADAKPASTLVDRTLVDACDALAIPCRWRTTVRSQIPAGAGLGSSAALCVALLRALRLASDCPSPASDVAPADERKREPWPPDLALARRLEARFHGRASGLDVAVAHFQQPCTLRQSVLSCIPVAVPELVLVGPSGTRSTRSVLAQTPTEFPTELCAEAEQLGDTALRALRTSDVAALGAVMARNHALLQRIGVSTPALDELVATTMAAGAWGAKLTGAGGGGCVLALPPPATGEAFCRKLRERGVPIVVRFGGTAAASGA